MTIAGAGLARGPDRVPGLSSGDADDVGVLGALVNAGQVADQTHCASSVRPVAGLIAVLMEHSEDVGDKRGGVPGITAHAAFQAGRGVPGSPRPPAPLVLQLYRRAHEVVVEAAPAHQFPRAARLGLWRPLPSAAGWFRRPLVPPDLIDCDDGVPQIRADRPGRAAGESLDAPGRWFRPLGRSGGAVTHDVQARIRSRVPPASRRGPSDGCFWQTPVSGPHAADSTRSVAPGLIGGARCRAVRLRPRPSDDRLAGTSTHRLKPRARIAPEDQDRARSRADG